MRFTARTCWSTTRVLVELKSVDSLAPIHTAQMLTYLKLSRKPVELLINFNASVLKNGLKRILNPDLAKPGQASPEAEDISSSPDPSFPE